MRKSAVSVGLGLLLLIIGVFISDFIIDLPDTLKNVNSLTLINTEIPNNIYTFSDLAVSLLNVRMIYKNSWCASN